ncbi:MAG TPA: hypothetical protein VG317_00295 [Pseudonocardiaceae bacterium]|nr:hypothetical protein [Pseudonocardiaceae bacterium]
MLDSTRFAHDPIAGDSAQFPLARPAGAKPTSSDEPSPVGVRPWNLCGVVSPSAPSRSLPAGWSYDPIRQIAVDHEGQPLVMGDPSADSISDNDGDEGRSEDWRYDYIQDDPNPAA